MKLSFFFFTVSILSLSASSYSQSKRFSIDKKNVTIAEVFSDIETKSEFSFLYSPKEIDISQSVSVSGKDMLITDILASMLAGKDIAYRITDKHIILFKADPEVSAIKLKRQGITISGTVTEASGESMPGVNIFIKGTATGVVSNENGKYQITVPGEDVTLVFSFIGYVAQEIVVGNRTSIDITLIETAQELEEVVVIGYGVQNKKTLTGSVSVVDVKNIELSSKPTISQTLQGKAAGLRVTQTSSQAGGGSKFRIRGEASINAGNDPLIVVDGIPLSSHGVLGSGNIYGAGPTDNLLEAFNPEDIESITILKDAASTAIYGARAGHGVILVTTKRGTKGQSFVTYSGNATVQTVAKNYEVLNPRQYMEARNMYAYEDYLRRYGLDIYEGYVSTPPVVPDYVAPFTAGDIQNATGTDWIGEVSRKAAVLQQHNLSLSGGGQTSRYMISLNFMDQNGIIKGNTAQRFSVRANLDKDFGKYFTAGITAMYSQNKYNNIPIDDGEYENAGLLRSAAQFNPTLPVRDVNGDYTIDPGRATATNPVAFLEITDVALKDRMIGSAYLMAKPLAGLELKFQLGADRRFQNRSSYLPKTTGEGKRKNGEANINKQEAIDYMMDATATYTKSFGDHHLKALAGYSFQLFTVEGTDMGNSDFLIDGYLYHNIGAGEYPKPSVGSYAKKSSLASYFGRINYDYKNRYLFEATLRADGASNFAPENRLGYFPSVAIGWLMSEESFMEPTKNWFSMFKLRASYGETGNYNVGYHIEDFFGTLNPAYVLGGAVVAGVTATDLGNRKLTWETTAELNVGLDLGFFNNRLQLTAEYFNREIRDLLSQQSLMSYFEVSSIYANIGKTQSKGFEITLNTVNFDNTDFGWNTTFTLSHYEDRWKERSPYWKPAPYQKEDDYIRSVFSFESMGLLQPGEQAPRHQTGLLPGMVILKNQNEGDPSDAEGNDTGNDYVLSEKDNIFKGTNDPDLVFGFNNMFRYKNFDLNIYFYGETGMTRGASYKESWSVFGSGGTQNLTIYAFDAFRHDNPDASKPSILGSSWGDFYMRDIYFIRCGNIRLGYNIPVSKKILKNFYAYINVDNPFVITNWTGLDPETDNLTFSCPNMRAYTIGLNVTF